MNFSIAAYIEQVRSGKIPVCKEQLLLCSHVERCFETEDIRIDEDQLNRYLRKQKYFPFSLLPWEEFCFALHNTVYRADGQLRWPVLFILVGRGAGKNGYLAFEDFCLLTPTNGIRDYHIDIFAMAEDQAKASFMDVYNVLEDNKTVMKRYFRWNKEVITNLATRSELRYRTSNPKTKDGGRPGKVDFDEYHAYQSYKLIEVATTGLGKKPHPRRTIITTNGDVRDGPLDHLIDKSERILKGVVPDNGTLPFLCKLDDEKELHERSFWPKANPSLPSFPTLQHELDIEYSDFQIDNLGNSAFATKRMNLPYGNREAEVTSWENLVAACRPLPDLTGKPCVFGIDYADTTDFVAAGLLFKEDDMYYWMTHTWVCTRGRDLSRVKFPLKDAQKAGLLSFVDDVEISTDIPALWLAEQAEEYQILMGGMDYYRWKLMGKALKDILNVNPDKGGDLRLLRPSGQGLVSPLITSMFARQKIIWGDNPLMRWYTNNTRRAVDGRGNVVYEKIEPKSRKTDGFMALVAAISCADVLDDCMGSGPVPDLPAFVLD